MSRPYTYTDEDALAWHEWYLAEPRRTLQGVADHFGLKSHSIVWQAFQRLGLPSRRQVVTPKRRNEPGYKLDPFGAAAEDIRNAVVLALENGGAMSQGEYDILVSIKELVS